jgi:hypothetical protein
MCEDSGACCNALSLYAEVIVGTSVLDHLLQSSFRLLY